MLNDIWISLPDESEESYTFRHMRKNQHEEVLFRCEDERFAIDMIIDSTATCLKRLEPIAEEVAMLQEQESFSEGYDSKEKMDIKSALDKRGMGSKVIKYSFDKSILNTIHRHAITRIYGDAGQEMLDLMSKNPVVAVPVVVKRLMQKLRDFKAAREVLNQRWKELAEINYYKSIDHRCLTWRTVNKRATSTRTLVSEIKDRAANNGYESEPSPSMFTPHFSMQYENKSFAQRDVCRILSFASKRGSFSPGDKEKCQRLWTDFLAQFFDLGSIWMQSPAVSYAVLPHHTPSIVSNDEESGNDDDDISAEEERDMVEDMMVTEEEMEETSSSKEKHTEFTLLSDQPIPSGCAVSTVYGEGVVTGYKSSDASFIVSLPFC
ncbi:paired amphipathic helix protein Sin3a [Chaetoceros tenuissimus]|uniref:Paired amphipathic helix protein Sin3a n=1 Tax=Chaetoceros tenuissimus TaxID=426638 RepID=A0AAD3CTJ2_9STRA|nr:paired amphipathic helix protein Sin3a [Chaetoceros tenuissimus]